MLLKRLSEYYDRVAAEAGSDPPTLYEAVPVRFIVELASDGRLLSRQPLDTADPSNRRTRFGVPRLVPTIKRTSGTKPLLLADSGEYTFGLADEKGGAKRAANRHAAYLELLRACAERTNHPAIGEVYRFLSGDPLSELDLPDEAAGALFTFKMDGQFVVDLPAVQEFWAEVNDPDADPNRPAPVLQCVVCGRERPALRRLRGSLKRVPGGQTAGVAMISANASAFESYGLEESYISPICAECAERFTRSANHLLASSTNRMTIGNAALIYWTRVEVDIDFFNLLSRPKLTDVKALHTALLAGGTPPEVDETAFYAAVLSGSGGRCVVRDYIDTTVGSVKRHVAKWFEDQTIVGPWGEEAEPLGIFTLAVATVRDARKDPPPTPVARSLWHAALAGTPAPFDLLYQAVRRNRAEQGVTRNRVTLIKLVLRGYERAKPDKEHQEDSMVRLNPEHENPAYHCGRLLSVLEQVQYRAMPGVKAGIVDRFYGSASAYPESVFGRLVRGAQPHLGTIERDLGKPVALAFKNRIDSIVAKIDRYPKVLTLEDQGLFSIGYYHQRAYDREQARLAYERKKAGRATAEDLAIAAADPEQIDNGQNDGNEMREEN